MKILIAEDELQNQKLLQRVLSKMGFENDIVDNGRDVVESKEKYDLLILDLSLPEIDGLETAQTIRRGATIQSSDLPILLISGKSKQLMQSYCNDFAINDFIEKPFGLEEFKSKVNQLLEL